MQEDSQQCEGPGQTTGGGGSEEEEEESREIFSPGGREDPHGCPTSQPGLTPGQRRTLH